MPKHKTTFIAWAAYSNPMAVEQYGVIDWTVEAWNVDQAARIVRERFKDEPQVNTKEIALVPAGHFHER